MSDSIYRRPYFYIIQHINSGKYYAGVKYAENANPDQLLKFNGYHTSSAIIKQIILEEGLESFVIRKIKIFETGEEALDYESRFLRRVNAAFNDNFLNRSNSSLSTLNVDLEKRKDTCLKKYCVEHVLQSEQIKEKSKQTFLSKYGVEHNSQVPEFQEKRKHTLMKNFGVEYPMQSEEVREKHKQIILEKYNCENVFQIESVKEKSKQTHLSKYGFENPSQSPEIKDKKKKTCLGTCGCEYPFQSEEVKEKSKQTHLSKYGFEYAGQVPENKEKSKQTLLRNYGVEHNSQSPEIKEKSKQTLIKTMNRPIVLEIIKYRDKFKLKLGCGWFYKSQEILDNLLAELKLTYDLENPSQISNSKEKMRKTINDLLNQPTISEIRKYRDKLKLKLGSGWYYKPQEFLDNLLIELKMSYGELE